MQTNDMPAAARIHEVEVTQSVSQSADIAAPAPRWHSIAKWAGNICGLGGGAAMAAFPEISLSAWAFVPFFLSHLIWSLFAWGWLRDKELLYLNLGALCLDIWAIVARIPFTSA